MPTPQFEAKTAVNRSILLINGSGRLHHNRPFAQARRGMCFELNQARVKKPLSRTKQLTMIP
jgi:hypothetical protein